MPLLRNTEQDKAQTLEVFYQKLADSPDTVSANIGTAMLTFIKVFNEMFPVTIVWGLTSHYHLILQNENKWRSKWLVSVIGSGNDEYYFEYLMPTDKSPWPDAHVKGTAKNLIDLKKRLLIAMRESCGWSRNAELKALLLQYNLA